MKTIWVARYYPDEEGRQVEEMGAFYSEIQATRVSQEKYGNWSASPVAVILYDSPEEFLAQNEKDIRKEALAKLTDREKKLLGLT
jgi:hypothetical protein